MSHPIINVINLDPDRIEHKGYSILEKPVGRYREERLLSIVSQSKNYGFAVRFWEGVHEKIAKTGISKAFKKVIRWAKENNLPEVIIAEDDMVFTSPGAWEYFLSNKPEDFDIYSAGIYSGMIEGNRIINGYSGQTLIIVRERMYDLILSADESGDLDRWLGSYCMEKQYIVCLPFVCKQLGGYSDNHRREVGYDAYHAEWEYYDG